MKKICTALCLIAMLLLGMLPCYADSVGITLETLVDYDNEKLTVSGITPAAYGQKISVVVYKPETPIDQLADVDNLENPEEGLPLKALAQIVRMEDVFASYNGDYRLTLPMSEAEAGFYVVSVSGNGTSLRSIGCRHGVSTTSPLLSRNVIPSIPPSTSSGISYPVISCSVCTYASHNA